MKVLTAALVVIALTLVAIVILLIVGLGYVVDLIETIEQLESAVSAVIIISANTPQSATLSPPDVY